MENRMITGSKDRAGEVSGQDLFIHLFIHLFRSFLCVYVWVTPGSGVLRGPSWWCSGSHMGCPKGARQMSSPLCNVSGPLGKLYFKECQRRGG